MANDKKVLESVMRGGRSIPFRDLERLLVKLGFQLARTSGSHRIYLHPSVPHPVSLQPVGKDAKSYQIRQIRDIIEKFSLALEE